MHARKCNENEFEPQPFNVRVTFLMVCLYSHFLLIITYLSNKQLQSLLSFYIQSFFTFGVLLSIYLFISSTLRLHEY